MELARPPSTDQRELLEYVFQAWYALGRLGGFNSLNLQARGLFACSAPMHFVAVTASFLLLKMLSCRRCF